MIIFCLEREYEKIIIF
ncbi:hypothetical protein MXB_2733 [Myxobolus squamalis]|nr:hypothetical protein MXB_2733 [Myxobolus squamalis]